jgi:hypothetical protein
MDEFVQAVLDSPAVRGFVAAVALKVISGLLHRRKVDPEFLKRSDEAFAQIANAKTPEEQQSAQMALSNLMSN